MNDLRLPSKTKYAGQDEERKRRKLGDGEHVREVRSRPTSAMVRGRRHGDERRHNGSTRPEMSGQGQQLRQSIDEEIGYPCHCGDNSKQMEPTDLHAHKTAECGSHV